MSYPTPWARIRANKTDGQRNHCLLNVRQAYGIAGKYPTAYAAWLGAGGHDGANTHYALTPVRGSVVFWSGGSSGAGHVAIVEDSTHCWTTDWNGKRGQWTLIKISDVARVWGLHYVGWSETLNGVRIVAHHAA